MADRLASLLASNALNGIDFVEVATDDQLHLVVHFLNDVAVSGTLLGAAPVAIIGGETVPVVPVADISGNDWGFDDEGRPLLHLTAAYAGDFSSYQLTIDSSGLDPYYSRSQFTFKARCPSDLDCAEPCCECPPLGVSTVEIDYLARDFDSFNRALTEYSTVAYPDWVERAEADIGVMLRELIASVGDDLSYLQDRVAAEATLPTATERRSVVRHARLVDYEPRPATSARTLMQVDVASASLPAGTPVSALRADGEEIWFELGDTMLDANGDVNAVPLSVDKRWNALDANNVPAIVPYWFDDSEQCLRAGATEMWVKGHGFGFVGGDVNLGTVGTAILIDTAAASSIDAPIREVVHLTMAAEEVDPLFNAPTTHLAWSRSERLVHDHDLSRTQLAGNLVPATQGQRYVERFSIEPTADDARPAVVRAGPVVRCAGNAPIYLHTLEPGRLAWLTPLADGQPMVAGEDDRPRPEVSVVQAGTNPGSVSAHWRWRRRLLDAPLFEDAYTVDPMRFADVRVGTDRVVGPPRFEYDGDNGDSLRFGDGVFGNRPPINAAFEVTYRVTLGAAGNVAADTITGIDPDMRGVLLRATNPFAATGGDDEEADTDVRRSAPYAFRARHLRAVRPEDYDEAAEELPWVLDAGTVFRWTGSWLTVFTTAQPIGEPYADVADRLTLVEQLERRRLAGYEVFTPSPIYVGIDLIVTVCARDRAFRGEVESAVLEELGTGRRRDGAPAFFAPDQFRFGSPLERSELEIATQRAPGVDGVVSVLFRRRGVAPQFVTMPETVIVGPDEIICVDNDPSRPERGSLRVVVEGGK